MMAASRATHRAGTDNIQQTMVDRLVALGKVALPFDPLEWLQGIQADTNVMGHRSMQRVDHMTNLGIYHRRAYKDAQDALKADPAYIKRKKSKPKGWFGNHSLTVAS